MRPKKCKTEKAQHKHLRITYLAAYILQKIREKRPQFDLGRYVSESLVEDFGSNEIDIDKFTIIENQKEIDRLYRENSRMVEKIKKRKEKIIMDNLR